MEDHLKFIPPTGGENHGGGGREARPQPLAPHLTVLPAYPTVLCPPLPLPVCPPTCPLPCCPLLSASHPQCLCLPLPHPTNDMPFAPYASACPLSPLPPPYLCAHACPPHSPTPSPLCLHLPLPSLPSPALPCCLSPPHACILPPPHDLPSGALFCSVPALGQTGVMVAPALPRQAEGAEAALGPARLGLERPNMEQKVSRDKGQALRSTSKTHCVVSPPSPGSQLHSPSLLHESLQLGAGSGSALALAPSVRLKLELSHCLPWASIQIQKEGSPCSHGFRRKNTHLGFE